MAEITASLVKELREMTGAGMMECKKALVEVEGDIESAVDTLRAAGLAAVAKKAGRATNEGTVVAVISDDGHAGAMVEVNCETDFVGINDVFKEYAERIARAALANKPADMDALLASDSEGETVQEVLTDAIHTLGENINLNRFAYVEVASGAVSSYIHAGGKIGVLVEFELGNKETAGKDDFKAFARDIAMQVAAAAPVSTSREDVDAEIIERELNIYKTQAAESGKPEEIQEKMAKGKIEKFYKENCLVEQAFVKDPDKSVSQYTEEVAKSIGDSIEIKGFTRFMLGQ